jgi:hypothetical protein
MSHACLMDVPFVTVIAIAFAYAGVDVFNVDLCGVRVSLEFRELA